MNIIYFFKYDILKFLLVLFYVTEVNYRHKQLEIQYNFNETALIACTYYKSYNLLMV